VGKRSEGIPQESGYVPPLPSEHLIQRRAENGQMVSYTPAEYGVRKDDGGGVVKPFNSAGGLLFLAILVTICFGGMLYGLVQIAITGQWDILGRTWWMFLLILVPLLGGWAGYFKERKAEKLRRARNLPRPVE
jgi:hypothetical protein